MSIQFKELVRVYDQYENQVDEKTKQYLAGFGTVDSSPKGLPLMEDIIDQYDRVRFLMAAHTSVKRRLVIFGVILFTTVF